MTQTPPHALTLAELDSQRFDAPLRDALRRALRELGAPGADAAALDAAVLDGYDLQCGAFALCKALKLGPAKAAEVLSAKLDEVLKAEGLGSCAPTPGAGFVNVRLDDAWLLARARAIGSPFPDASGLRVLIDYSSPNCAKRMHVGHLRSTVIGDAARGILAASGADVEIVNHLGDWGTPFGIIVEQAADEGVDIGSLDLEAIEGVYKRGQERFAAEKLEPAKQADPAAAAAALADGQAFARRAREATARMQARDGAPYQAWKTIRARTLAELQRTYDLLGVALRPEHAIGESAYQEASRVAVDELLAKGLAVSGPQGVAYLGAKNPLPLEKSAQAGGGFLYGGTDAAALKLRGQSGRWLLYVTDDRQAEHFAALFDMGAKAGWIAPGQATHVPFGTMMGADGKPFKSRKGGAMPLTELVEEALDVARAATLERLPNASVEEVDAFARPIGVGALKYGDLSRSRTTAVKFDVALACRLDGDTGPYLQYARTRAVSALGNAAGLPDLPRALPPQAPLAPSERALLLAMGRMRDAAIGSIQSCEPHRLCKALYEASSEFSRFYEHCPCAQFPPTEEATAQQLAELQLLYGAPPAAPSRDPLRLWMIERFASMAAQALESIGVQALDSMPRAPEPAPQAQAPKPPSP